MAKKHDPELKALLIQLLQKLDGIEMRLAAVEAKSHEQVTEEELRRRFNEFPPPGGSPGRSPFLPGAPRWDSLHAQTLPALPNLQAYC